MDLSIGTGVVYGLPVVKIRPWPWFVGFHSRVTYGFSSLGTSSRNALFLQVVKFLLMRCSALSQ